MKRWIASVLLLGAVTANAEMPDRSTPAKFTADVARQLRARAPKITVEEHELSLHLKTPAGGADWSLDRLWKFCSDAAHDCAGELETQLAAVTDMAAGHEGGDAPPQLAQLRALVRPKATVDAYGARLTGKTLIVEPIAGDLWLVVGVDTPRATAWATDTGLAPLKKSRAEIIAAARANTDADLGPLAPHVQPGALGAGSAGYIQTGNAYEASRLLQHDQWKPYAAKGKLLVSVPANDMVMFCVDCPPIVLQAMTRKAAAESATPLSQTVLRWTPAGWQPL